MEESGQRRGKGHSDTFSLSSPSLRDTDKNDIGPEKQRCFLCFHIISVASGSNSGHESESDLFLRQLCHYLKITQQISVNSDTKIFFCNKCKPLCSEFKKVFQLYELAQLRLHNVMEKISTKFGENSEPEPVEPLATDNLRKVINEKTQVQLQKLKSPLILIERLTQDKNPLLTSTSTSSMESEIPAEEDAASTFRSRPRIRKTKKKIGRPRQVPAPNTFLTSVTGELKCCHCSKSFPSKTGWQAHFESIHNSIRHKCEENAASATSRSRPRIRKTKKNIGQTNKTETEGRVGASGFKCKYCDLVFPTFLKRRNHYTAQRLRFSYLCEKCQFIVIYKCGMAPHRENCEGAELTRIDENAPTSKSDTIVKDKDTKGDSSS